MNWNRTQPCPECPFLTGDFPGDQPVRLTEGRIREIAGGVMRNPGATFACHKTTTVGGAKRGREAHCAGALLFMFATNPEWTQMARIASRIGVWNPDKLTGEARVFRSLRDFLASALDRRTRVRKER